jgi:hypothetical protein
VEGRRADHSIGCYVQFGRERFCLCHMRKITNFLRTCAWAQNTDSPTQANLSHNSTDYVVYNKASLLIELKSSNHVFHKKMRNLPNKHLFITNQSTELVLTSKHICMYGNTSWLVTLALQFAALARAPHCARDRSI